jgi:hypothetical protein
MLVILTLSFLAACSTNVSKRDIASAKEHDEAVHRGFIGTFDHQ